MKCNPIEKGQALILVLFFSLIASLMILAIMYLVLRGTAVSGMQKRYQTSLDAGYAGVSAQTRYLTLGSYAATDPMFVAAVNLNPGLPGSCTYQKLFFELAFWSACGVNEKALDAQRAPDSIITVNGQGTSYEVTQKIVDTRRGLTAQRPPGVEIGSGVAYGSETGLAIQQQAYVYYAVEVKARDTEKGEVARISFDYAW